MNIPITHYKKSVGWGGYKALLTLALLMLLSFAATSKAMADVAWLPYVKFQLLESGKYYMIFSATSGATIPDGCYPLFENGKLYGEDVSTNYYTGYLYSNSANIAREDIEAVAFNPSFIMYQPTDLSCLFYNFENLTNAYDLVYISTAEVTNMSQMFYGCHSLKKLDLASFNTQKVKNAAEMFSYCYNLEVIYVGSNWDMSKEASNKEVFFNNVLLIGGAGTFAGISKAYDASYAIVDGTNNNPGLLTESSDDMWAPDQKDLAFSVYPYEFTQYITDNIDRQESRLRYIPNQRTFIVDEISGYNKYKSGKQNITVKFRNKRYTFTVDVAEFKDYIDDIYPYVDAFEVGTKLKDIMFEVESTQVFGVPLSELKYTGDLDLTKPGKYNITVTLGDAEWTGDIEVYKPVNGLDFSKLKTTNLNQNIYELPSGDVTVTYTDNTTEDIDFSEMILNLDNYANGYIDVVYHNVGKKLDITFADNAPNAYAALKGKTLTFYYGDKSVVPSDVDELFTFPCPWDNDAPDWADDNYDISSVVITPDFANYHPTSCYEWFLNMFQLETITGLEYLNTDKVTNMEEMFYGCERLSEIRVGANWQTAKNAEGMFNYCERLIGGAGTIYNDEKCDGDLGIIDGGAKAPGYLTGPNQTQPTITSAKVIVSPDPKFFVLGATDPVFVGGKLEVVCGYTQQIDMHYSLVSVSGFDPFTTKPQTAYAEIGGIKAPFVIQFTAKEGLFYIYDKTTKALTFYYGEWREGAEYISDRVITDEIRAQALTVAIDESVKGHRFFRKFEDFNAATSITGLSNMDFTHADFYRMFAGCAALKSIDLSGIDSRNIYDMSEMFSGCTSLEYIDLTKFYIDKTEIDEMFSNCTALKEIDLSIWSCIIAIEYNSVFDDGKDVTLYLDGTYSGIDDPHAYYPVSVFGNATAPTEGDIIKRSDGRIYVKAGGSLILKEGTKINSELAECSIDGNKISSIKSSVSVLPSDAEYIFIDLSKRSFTYNGTDQKNKIQLLASDDKTLTANDYDIYINGVKNGEFLHAGEYTVTVKGKNGYIGEVTAILVIVPIQLSVSWPSDQQVFTYNGEQQYPVPELENTSDLVAGDKNPIATDAINYPDEYIYPDFYTIEAISTNPDYEVDGWMDFRIIHVKVSNPVVTVLDEAVYNGGLGLRPEVKVTYTDKAGKTQTADPKGYSVEYINNINAGTAMVKVYSDEGYSDFEVSTTFEIAKADPKYDKPLSVTLNCQQTVSSIAFTKGFALANPDATLKIGENTIYLTYTPDDTKNYNIVKDIPLTVIVKHGDPETDPAKAATCTETGLTAGTHCPLCKEVLTKQETVPALEHDYKVTYTWSNDGKSCTATAICQNNADHTVTETATITSKVTTAASTTSKGTTTYTATFTNSLFKTQTKEIQDIPQLTPGSNDNPGGNDTPGGNDNPETPVSSVTETPSINVWSYNHTIYIENAPADAKYKIIDLNGRVITTSTTKSTRNEIHINQSGIMIVIIGKQSFKVAL